ncbi:hypothetical protein B296_00033730 [Ensete ventricosum]|uniref:Uncharacterized protein n=1 Tax=Ensete ventricosum TaxID=4639 RepID=A0A426ZWI2_ENSVE|nr:hypothetical protein B296_00033730 [Ensete ventricosum]
MRKPQGKGLELARKHVALCLSELSYMSKSLEFLRSLPYGSCQDDIESSTTASGCKPIGFDASLNSTLSAPGPPRATHILSWKKNPLSFYLMEQLLKSKDCHLDMYRPVRAVISSPAGDFFSLRGEKKRFPAWGEGTTRPVCPVRTAQYRVLYHTELSWY